MAGLVSGRAERLGAAAGVAGAGAIAAYAVLRAVQHVIQRDADPATVLYAPHAGYVWRAATALYVGGMLGALAWLASPDPAPTLRLLSPALALAVLLLAAQALFLP